LIGPPLRSNRADSTPKELRNPACDGIVVVLLHEQVTVAAHSLLWKPNDLRPATRTFHETRRYPAGVEPALHSSHVEVISKDAEKALPAQNLLHVGRVHGATRHAILIALATSLASHRRQRMGQESGSRGKRMQ